MYTINVLIPFELVVDVDMGLLKLIEFDYHNDEYFYPGVVNAPEEDQQYLLNIRKHKNPLSVIMKDEHKDLIDDFYNQFIEKEYDQILTLSCNTSLADLSVALKVSMDQVIRLTILCKDKKQEDLLKFRKIPCFRTLVSKYESVDLRNYDTIYVKDATDLDKFKGDIFQKNIYIANYGFNITIEPDTLIPLLPEDTIYKYGGKNELYLVSVYEFDPHKLPLE